MNSHCYPTSVPAPCIVSTGILVNKNDIRRLLQNLVWVHYQDFLDGNLQSEGEGWIVEIFDEPMQATIVVNQSLYLNLQSFDYLALKQSQSQQTYFELVQDNRILRLDITEGPQQKPQEGRNLRDCELEEMVTQVLSARWDVHFDDDDNFRL